MDNLSLHLSLKSSVRVEGQDYRGSQTGEKGAIVKKIPNLGDSERGLEIAMEDHLFQIAMEDHLFQIAMEDHLFQIAMEDHLFQIAMEDHSVLKCNYSRLPAYSIFAEKQCGIYQVVYPSDLDSASRHSHRKRHIRLLYFLQAARLTSNIQVSFCIYITGFLILILMFFVKVWLVTCAPSQKICDSRVLDKYIGEVMEIANTMDSCNVLCDFPEDVTVPETKLNQAEWTRLHMSQKAAIVWRGLNLFTEAVPNILNLISDSKLKQPVEKFVGVSRNVVNILKSHNLQVETIIPQSDEKTRSIRTLKQFFSVYTNFLRGKYKLLIIAVCK
ncbi:erythropoietin [Pelodytes ibericus]